ncbi:MAG: ORF6N domain-containing protein [Gammaproteobacteria bacterium]|nr:MAG: ORF6N domain-containing protein [Gammaproteobacteria bacterium]TLZ32150.1 MAG: ORF6N domain-containing protein [Gammaproteobacteria bacterium]
MARSKAFIRAEDTTPVILVLRGQRIILDRDLAAIYGVTTKRLNEQVKRNAERSPEDFMFQLTPEEAELGKARASSRSRGRRQV